MTDYLFWQIIMANSASGVVSLPVALGMVGCIIFLHDRTAHRLLALGASETACT